MASRVSPMPRADERLPTWTVLGAGAVLGVGSLLPWATATTIFGQITKDGTSSDGVLTLLCAVVLVGLGGAMLIRYVGVGWIAGGTAVSAVALGIACYDAVTLPAHNQYASVDVGFGLWLCLISSLTALVATTYIAAARRRELTRSS